MKNSARVNYEQLLTLLSAAIHDEIHLYNLQKAMSNVTDEIRRKAY